MDSSNRDAILENESRLKKIYYIAVKTRNFEISQLVQRNNFFMVFQGVLLASIIYSSNTVPFVQFVICITGCYIALQQTKAAAGAKFWQEHWEYEVIKAEKELAEFYKKKTIAPLSFVSIFDQELMNIETHVSERLNKNQATKFPSSIWNLFSINKLILEKPSVSKIPIRVGRCLTIIWAVLALSSIGIFSQGLQILTEKGFFHGFPNHKEAAKQEIYLSQDKGKTGALYVSNDKERNHKNEIIGQSLPFEISNNPLLNNKTDNRSEVSEPKTQSNEVYLNINIDGKDAITQYEPNNLGNK